MDSSFILSLVLTVFFLGSSLSSLLDYVIAKKSGEEKERRASVRLTLFFLFASFSVISFSYLIIFTSFRDSYLFFTSADYLYYFALFSLGFFCTLWYKTILPICASIYVLIFLSYSYFLDKTCLSYASPVMISFDENLISIGEKVLPVISSLDEKQDNNMLNTGYLVVQEYLIPVQLLLPLHKRYYRLAFFSQNRIVQDDFGRNLFDPDLYPDSSVFFNVIRSLLQPLTSLVVLQDEDLHSVFYFIEISLSDFYPYVFSLQTIKKEQGFSYILDKLI